MELFLTAARAEEAAAAEPSQLEKIFGKFAEFPLWAWIVVAVLLIGGLIAWKVLKPAKAKTVWSVKMLALGAICIALSNVLSMIKLFSMPSGGSVTLASMLPIMLFAYVYGAGPGVLVGALYGTMHFILKPWFLSVPQVILEYPIAFGLIGLAGLFHKDSNTVRGLTLGVIVGCLGRYLAAVLAGVVFWADAANGNPWLYSLGYNGGYMGVECVICIVVTLLIGPRLVKELQKQK